MSYASMGILALVIQLIIEYDVYMIKSGREFIPALKQYRRFLLCLTVYYIADVSWGLIYDARIMPVARLATTLFFATVALSVFLWTRYVIAYLDGEKLFARVLSVFGWLFVAVEAVVLILNEFFPLVFYFNESDEYIPCRWRYIMLVVQVLLFFVTAAYTLYVALRATGTMRHRYLTISISGIALTILIAEQTKYPLLPLYSVGCLLSVCIIHRFVVEGEKDDYRRELEELLETEKRQRNELGEARSMINTDALTGVKSKYAYSETEKRMDERIRKGESTSFSVVIFDLNGLKYINDHYGHEQGDLMIREACSFVCNHFAHSPVFRVGGDEFVAVLEGQDYDNRDTIIEAFNLKSESNLRNNEVVVAAGMADFLPGQDLRFSDVFDKADKNMYERKKILKIMSGADSD